MKIILFSAIAGTFGMGLGGLIPAVLLKRPSENMICRLLSFAAGIMVSVVCFGIVPETIKLAGSVVCGIGLIIGIAAVMALNRVIDGRKTEGDERKVRHSCGDCHASRFIEHPEKMLQSGILTLVAVAMHHIPMGIAIGAGGAHDHSLGILLITMIAIHNFPEGMAIAAPLLASGVSRSKVVLLTALGGGTTLLGGIIGFGIGRISSLAVALSLAVAAGAMLYVVFDEILPQVTVMSKNRTASIVTLFGIIVGFFATIICC